MKVTDPYAFIHPGTQIPPDVDARCVHCGRSSDLVKGDGPVIVCRSCIRARTELADDPSGAPEQVIETMQARHGDVVLITTTVRPGEPRERRWDWIGWA
jgi:hypothetical protein